MLFCFLSFCESLFAPAVPFEGFWFFLGFLERGKLEAFLERGELGEFLAVPCPFDEVLPLAFFERSLVVFSSFAFIDWISCSNFVTASFLLVVSVFSCWRSKSLHVSATLSSIRPSRTGRDALGSLAILEEIFEALSDS